MLDKAQPMFVVTMILTIVVVIVLVVHFLQVDLPTLLVEYQLVYQAQQIIYLSRKHNYVY